MRIADLHCDTVGRIQAGMDIATGRHADTPAGVQSNRPVGHVDIPRMRAGGVGLQAFAAYIPPETDPTGAFDSALSKIESIEAMCKSNPDDLKLVTTAGSAERAVADDRIGVLLTVENGHAIEESLQNLETLRRRGVRMMALVHSKNLNWVASCSETTAPFDGISAFGGKVVDAMNEMGMIVDVSHAHESAFWKVADRMRGSERPFIASHSNAWELCRIPRNLKDDQIRAIADQGGVIGINFFASFLDKGYSSTAVERTESVSVPIGAVVRHIDHMVNLAGDDCVAFGSDFDGIPSTPEGITGSDCYPAILGLLEAHGYSETRIEKIAWRNFMRVFRAHD